MSILSILMKSEPDEPASGPQPDCPLCAATDEAVIWRGAFWRLIDVRQPEYPGYIRLVLNRHVTELSWLAKPEHDQLFKLLLAIDELMRKELRPQKINIASLGNQTPHMHWHIIPRWQDDPHFPQSIWSSPQRELIRPPDERQQAVARLFEKLPKICAKTVY
jgi:diadenosine tetraphosphate (Ap4A) HIT family hydrolase